MRRRQIRRIVKNETKREAAKTESAQFYQVIRADFAKSARASQAPIRKQVHTSSLGVRSLSSHKAGTKGEEPETRQGGEAPRGTAGEVGEATDGPDGGDGGG